MQTLSSRALAGAPLQHKAASCRGRKHAAVRAVAAPPVLSTKRSEQVTRGRARIAGGWGLAVGRYVAFRVPRARCKPVGATWRVHPPPHHSQIFKEAQDLLPGGVNSPVRAFKSVGGGPIVFDRVKVRGRAGGRWWGGAPLSRAHGVRCCCCCRAQGAYCWDVDNNKYIDYVGGWVGRSTRPGGGEGSDALSDAAPRARGTGHPPARLVQARGAPPLWALATTR